MKSPKEIHMPKVFNPNYVDPLSKLIVDEIVFQNEAALFLNCLFIFQRKQDIIY